MEGKDPKDYPNRVKVNWRSSRGCKPAWWVRTVERGRKAGNLILLIRKLDKDLSERYDASDISRWFKWVEVEVEPDKVAEPYVPPEE